MWCNEWTCVGHLLIDAVALEQHNTSSEPFTAILDLQYCCGYFLKFLFLDNDLLEHVRNLVMSGFLRFKVRQSQSKLSF